MIEPLLGLIVFVVLMVATPDRPTRCHDWRCEARPAWVHRLYSRPGEWEDPSQLAFGVGLAKRLTSRNCLL